MRHGDTVSPKVFTACFESVFQKLTWDLKGIIINGKYLNHLRFADDNAVIADNIEEMQEMLRELKEVSRAIGFHMNFKKIPVMIDRKISQNSEIKVYSETVQMGTYYGHLSQHIPVSRSEKEEIKRRTRPERSAFDWASSPSNQT